MGAVSVHVTLGMASFSPFSPPSSESEQVCVSLKDTSGLRRGRWSGWKVSCVLSRLLTACRELQVLGGSDGSASRSVIMPWASPITAMSTVTLVPEDYRGKNRDTERRRGNFESPLTFDGRDNRKRMFMRVCLSLCVRVSM